MSEVIVWRVHDDTTEAHRQWKETLCNSRVPDLRIEQLLPIRFDEENDPVHSTIQGYRSDQQAYHDDVRKDREEIGRFPWALHATCQDSKYAAPRDEQANR